MELTIERTRFDAGLYDMCPHEIRRLTIAPEFGYGRRGVPGTIPPNATLVFDVELMGARDGNLTLGRG